MESTKHNLKKLKEYVYDEDKVVTFKWLSAALNIQVEDSKELLEKFAAENKELDVIYWICGKLEDNSCSTSLINKDELDNKISEYTNVSHKFIYSICRPNKVDVKDLLVNVAASNCISGILTNSRCSKRILMKKAPLPDLKKTDICKQKPSLFSNVPPKSIKNDVAVSKPSETGSTLTTKKENGNVKGIAGFISKMPPKQKAKSDSIQKTDVKESQQVLEDNKAQNEKENKLKNVVDSDDSEEEKRVPKSAEEKPKSKKSNSSNNKRKRDISNSKTKNQKQRKRIVEPNDSDSDDIFDSADKEEVEEPIKVSDDEELVYKPKPKLGPKNKRRKLVNQTYEDEDGYIMTRKEWVYVDGESEGEEEQESENKSDVKKNEKKIADNSKNNTKAVSKNDKEENNTGNSKGRGSKTKKPANGQTTLMNFFKKS